MLVLTARESNEILNGLDLLKVGLYKVNSGSFENTLQNNRHLLQLLEENGVSNNKESLTEEVLTNLRDTIRAAENVRITSSFVVGYSGISKIKKWFYDNVDYNVILDINYDPELVGGIQIISQGRYLDLSLVTKLNKYFEGFENASQLPR